MSEKEGSSLFTDDIEQASDNVLQLHLGEERRRRGRVGVTLDLDLATWEARFAGSISDSIVLCFRSPMMTPRR
jgi:hypothetical protein